jgi:hypothetical protein
MSNGNVALQANFKTASGALLNVYGETAEQFEFNLRAFNALLGDIIATDRAVQSGQPSAPSAVATVLAAVGGQVISETPVYAPPVAQAPVAAPTSGAPACRHGQMVFIDGTQKGKTWKGHFCPQPKDAVDKCAPIFQKG